MSSKQEMGLYPQAETLPGSPPQYDAATAPPQQRPTNMMAPPQEPQQNVYVIPGAGIPLGPQSCRVTCPSCHQTQMTKTKYVNTTKTHLIALILCLTTCCCCIPYCIDTCKSAQHTCSNCGAYLGSYNN